MGLRISNGKNGKRRLTRAIAVPSALGVAALVATPWLSPATTNAISTALTGAAGPDCYDMVSIAVGGRGDVPTQGSNQFVVAPDGTVLPASMASSTNGGYSSHWVDPVINAPKGSVSSDSYAAVYVEYPADMASYEDAVNAGVANTETIMKSIAKSCPNTKFAVVGYSEGADVARRVAMDVGNQPAGSYQIVDPNSVVGVVILADAGRSAGDGPFPGASDPFSHPDGYTVPFQTGTTATSGQGAMQDQAGSFGALDGKVAAFCDEGDLTCAAPQSIALLQLVANVARQVNVDALQRDGLTVATGSDVANVIGRVTLSAFSYIAEHPEWMQSDETFLDVLLKVSEPGYKPDQAVTPVAADGEITTGQLVDLSYLPDKIVKEIVGFIQDNQNTIQVAMSDPYQQTLGPDVGHHFDYWRDASAANGQSQSSAQYAAAWLTYLAQQAAKGEPATTASAPAARLAAAATSIESSTSVADPTPTGSPTDTPTSTAGGSPTSTGSSDATSSTSTAESSTDPSTPDSTPWDPTPGVNQVAEPVDPPSDGGSVVTTEDVQPSATEPTSTEPTTTGQRTTQEDPTTSAGDGSATTTTSAGPTP